MWTHLLSRCVQSRTRDTEDFVMTTSDDVVFTSTVLLVSSAARIAVEEIDLLIARGPNSEHQLRSLVRARSGVAALAAIADYLERRRQFDAAYNVLALGSGSTRNGGAASCAARVH